MTLWFPGAKYTRILLLRKKFIFLVPSKHKLDSSKLMTYIHVFVDTGVTVILKIKVSIS